MGVALQVVLVMMVGWMLIQRRDPARFAAHRGRIVHHHRPVAARPARDRDDAQLLRRASGGRDRDGTHRLLVHGTTIHGAERIRDADGTPVAGRPEPLTYYYFGGPISEVASAARARRAAS